MNSGGNIGDTTPLLELTEAEVVELRRLEAEATRPPWVHEECCGDHSVRANGYPVAAWTYAYPEGPIDLEEEDAKFIPLLGLLRRCRVALDDTNYPVRENDWTDFIREVESFLAKRDAQKQES